MKTNKTFIALAVFAAALVSNAEDKPTAYTQASTETSPSAMLIDGVAAYINSDMITIAEVMNEVRRSPWVENNSRITESRLRELYQLTLNALIDRKLILNAANKQHLQLPSWTIENRIREIIEKRFNNDESKLHELLADMKVSFEEWRKTIEEDLTVTAMRYQYVEKKVHPTPLQIREEYEANPRRYQTETATAVSMIILDPPGEGENSVVMRAGEIKMALEKGEKFADLAKKYSKDTKAKDGGSWGKVNPDDVFRKEIADVVHKLTPGEVSDVLMLDGYGYIVRKDEAQDARILTFDEAQPYVENRLRVRQSEKLYKEWIDRLRAEAYIKIFELPKR